MTDKREAKKVKIREGYQGAPLPSGAKVDPPPGPAADVPAKKASEQKPSAK